MVKKVGGRSSSVVPVLKRYYHFSLRVTFFQIPDRFHQVAQWVASVNDGHHLSRLQQSFQKIRSFWLIFAEETHFPLSDP